MSIFSSWKRANILGWNFDTVEKVKDAFVRVYGNTIEQRLNNYRNGSFRKSVEPLFSDSAIKLNLGGDNEKVKIEFSDRPIGVFDFSLASQQLFRVHEFYSPLLAKEMPDIFEEFRVPAGVVPNYYVEKEKVNNEFVFFYLNKATNNKYFLQKRQKGLTKALNENPSLAVRELNGMLIPDKPVKGVEFSSRTKKPYVKYKRRGGKVKYVEIYSLNYYTDMNSNDFFMACRHIPAVMVCEYLEKMGTMCKFFITRFVSQTDYSAIPREFDKLTNAVLPLYTEWVSKMSSNRTLDSLIIQPMCAKEYGGEVDKNFIFALGSDSVKDIYIATYREMTAEETTNPSNDPYGQPSFKDENRYQEGFERFRQKQLQYTQLGIWKAKEIVEQGLIYFHDRVMNLNFEDYCGSLINSIDDEYPDFSTARRQQSSDVDYYTFGILYTPNSNKWFELWMRTSANTIKHKLDIFNASNSRKVYEEVGRELDATVEEMSEMIRTETKPRLKTFYTDWKRFMIRSYNLTDKTAYCTERINDMTIYAKGGEFATPIESIEKRDAEAKRLIDELEKVSF